MRLAKRIAINAGWFSLWFAIPAALLYPLALWMQKHTRLSEEWLEKSYLLGVSILFFPTGFLVDFLYRRFIRDRHGKSPQVTEDQ
jgi:hypothetical protein